MKKSLVLLLLIIGICIYDAKSQDIYISAGWAMGFDGGSGYYFTNPSVGLSYVKILNPKFGISLGTKLSWIGGGALLPDTWKYKAMDIQIPLNIRYQLGTNRYIGTGFLIGANLNTKFNNSELNNEGLYFGFTALTAGINPGRFSFIFDLFEYRINYFNLDIFPMNQTEEIYNRNTPFYNVAAFTFGYRL